MQRKFGTQSWPKNILVPVVSSSLWAVYGFMQQPICDDPTSLCATLGFGELSS